MILYVIFNEVSDKYYIGVIDNLERRLKEHNGDTSHFTGRIEGNWFVKFSRVYESSKDARVEEKRLKKAGNRRYLEWYITNQGPLAQR